MIHLCRQVRCNSNHVFLLRIYLKTFDFYILTFQVKTDIFYSTVSVFCSGVKGTMKDVERTWEKGKDNRDNPAEQKRLVVAELDEGLPCISNRVEEN